MSQNQSNAAITSFNGGSNFTFKDETNGIESFSIERVEEFKTQHNRKGSGASNS